jgi:two-component system chemotaxis response regulator CheB
VVVIAGSAGAIGALGSLISGLPADLAAAIFVVQHRPPDRPSFLVDLLQRNTTLLTKEAEEGEWVRSGTLYVAPVDRHVTITPQRTIHLLDRGRILNLLSSANPLFESAAAVCGERTVGVVLSGFGSDAREGALALAAAGGTVLAQDPSTASVPGMPYSAIASGAVCAALPVEALAGEIAGSVRAWKGQT